MIFQETIKHFESKDNIHIPESTIRGLRKAYLNTISSNKDGGSSFKTVGKHESTESPLTTSVEEKCKTSTQELSELHCGKRGRPMRLGKVRLIISMKSSSLFSFIEV